MTSSLLDSSAADINSLAGGSVHTAGLRTLDCLLVAGEGTRLRRRRYVTNSSGGMDGGTGILRFSKSGLH